MKAQTPADGILKTGEFGDSKFYKVPCSCGNDDHTIDFEVEADEMGINVNTWITQKTDFWSKVVEPRYDIDNPWLQEFNWAVCEFVNGLATRLRLTWNIWVHGYVKYESTTVMTEQQALNYAETIKCAITDVTEFRNKRERAGDLVNKIASKLAKEGDCA